MMARPTQKFDGKDLQDAILAVAYKQIAKNGAAALSLRAIARELGVTAPAIYNYYHRRDNLVTALILEAYSSLGKSQRSAVSQVDKNDLAAQLSALGLAYRDWAITYPQRYQLIFGTPIPHYEAPQDTTVPAAAWALQPLIKVLALLQEVRRLRMDYYPTLSAALEQMLSAWQSFIIDDVVEDDRVKRPGKEALYMALVIWSRVHGLVMLEIGGQLPSFISDPGEIFKRELTYLVNQLVIDDGKGR
jgi:AcrR family transcriptional regulator